MSLRAGAGRRRDSGLASGTVSAQAPTTSTSTQTRQFEIVSVDGNKVVVSGAEGYREITVADDFRLTVDGRAVGVRELKPGMKGTATITTTTTSTPVTVTQVRDGVVMQKTGNSIVVRTADGIKMFSEGTPRRVACGFCATVRRSRSPTSTPAIT